VESEAVEKKFSLTMTNLMYRRALKQDYGSIVRLNAANFIANLSVHERADGFLSGVVAL